MQLQDVTEQVDYLFWVRDRVLTAAATLSPTDFVSSETVTTRSLRATLVHQLECEWAWRIRLAEGAFPAGNVRPDDFPSLGALARRWQSEEQALRDWLDRQTDADLQSSPPGPDNPLPRWRYLLYVVNHGVQQFSEAAVMLTRLDRSPGEIGFLEFCSRPSRPEQ
ncbi:MAG: DinB family protein [Chloroflexota bacterium]